MINITSHIHYIYLCSCRDRTIIQANMVTPVPRLRTPEANALFPRVRKSALITTRITAIRRGLCMLRHHVAGTGMWVAVTKYLARPHTASIFSQITLYSFLDTHPAFYAFVHPKLLGQHNSEHRKPGPHKQEPRHSNPCQASFQNHVGLPSSG